MFDFKLKGNITDHVMPAKFDPQSFRYEEQKGNNYFDLDVTDLMGDQQESVYFDKDFITFDKRKRIHQITASFLYEEKSRCPVVGERIIKNLGKQFKIKLKKEDAEFFTERDLYFMALNFDKNQKFSL